MLAPWKKGYDQPRQDVKKQRHHFANKGPSSQGYGFSSSHVWMWELEYKESWAPKNRCFWTVVLEKTLESPFDCKEIQPVHPKGNQSWIFNGRTDFATWCKELTHWKRPRCWETLETVSDFILGGSRITADGDCSHEIKRLLLLERKAMTNLDSILKSRDISLPTEVHLSKAMVFPVVMYGCESWTI